MISLATHFGVLKRLATFGISVEHDLWPVKVYNLCRVLKTIYNNSAHSQEWPGASRD